MLIFGFFWCWFFSTVIGLIFFDRVFWVGLRGRIMTHRREDRTAINNHGEITHHLFCVSRLLFSSQQILFSLSIKYSPHIFVCDILVQEKLVTVKINQRSIIKHVPAMYLTYLSTLCRRRGRFNVRG